MRDTRLIFVEGLPGLGKSTTASWLAWRLQSERLAVRLYLEHQPEHPLNVGGDSHPAGDVPGDMFFQQYSPESFVEESLRRWGVYTHEACQENVTAVFDSYPFQNTVRVLLQLNASIDAISQYAHEVENLVKPLKPVLIYLNQPDFTQAVNHMDAISQQRGKEWSDYVEALITNCPYSVTRNLRGASAVTAFISDYKGLIDNLLRQSHLPRIILEHCSSNWESCYHQIEEFLELPWQAVSE